MSLTQEEIVRTMSRNMHQQEEITEVSVEEDHDDDFQDVKEMVARAGFQVQASGYQKANRGANIITLTLSGSSERPECPFNQDAVAQHKVDKIQVSRAKGFIQLQCSCSNLSGPNVSQASLAHLIEKSGVKNHADLALYIAPEAKQVVAFDIEGDARVFQSQLGTWLKQSKPMGAYQALRRTLVNHIDSIIANTRSRSRMWPTGKSPVKSAAEKWIRSLQRAIQDTGKTLWMQHFGAQFTSLLLVRKEVWESHFKGFLPLRNALVEFKTDASEEPIVVHQYSWHQYVRSEYQCDVIWRPEARSELLVSAMAQWWTTDQVLPWLQAVAYALSRSACMEKFFVIQALPSTAKSTFFSLLKCIFGDSNVFIHPRTELITQKAGARTFNNGGQGHDSACISMYDKAIVQFNEPDQGSLFRQGLLKKLSGDDQAGRRAYSANTQSYNRCFTMFILCNAAPLPEDPGDDALRRRMNFLTSNRVFYGSEEKKQKLLSMMSDAEVKSTALIPADPGVIKRLKEDGDAHSYLVLLLACAWKILIQEQQKTFLESPQAAQLRKDYWSAAVPDEDMVSRFLEDSVELTSSPMAHIPHATLFRVYCAWFNKQLEQRGPFMQEDTCVTTQKAFIKRVLAHFEYAKPAPRSMQRSAPSRPGLNTHQTQWTKKVRGLIHLRFTQSPLVLFNSWERVELFQWHLIVQRLGLSNDHKLAVARYLDHKVSD